MTALHVIVVTLLAYLLGGIPTAYLAGRLRGIDIRRHGSGNVGGTNALRVMGWKVGLPVMAFDVGKGILAVFFLPKIPLSGLDPVYLAITAGMAVVLGHVFTPALGFRGGKGVAAGIGALLFLAPIPMGICLGLFALVLLGTGIMSLASMTTMAALPLITYLIGRSGFPVHPAIQWLTVALALVILCTHRSNIRRLIQGKENRFRRPWEPRSSA